MAKKALQGEAEALQKAAETKAEAPPTIVGTAIISLHVTQLSDGQIHYEGRYAGLPPEAVKAILNNYIQAQLDEEIFRLRLAAQIEQKIKKETNG